MRASADDQQAVVGRFPLGQGWGLRWPVRPMETATHRAPAKELRRPRLPRFRVPKLKGTIRAARDQDLPVGAEPDAEHREGMVFQCRYAFLVLQVPDIGRGVLTAAGQQFAVGTEGQTGNDALGLLEVRSELAARKVEHLDRAAQVRAPSPTASFRPSLLKASD